MNIIETEIEGVKLIEPVIYGNAREWFISQYNPERYHDAGITETFLYDAEYYSPRGVMRGLRWQAAPHDQAKLVHVARGSAYDVVVDLRKDSPTFGHHYSTMLSGINRHQLYIPRGFAHGFIVMEDNTLIVCKMDAPICIEASRGILFSDPELNIEWPSAGVPLKVSDLDKKLPCLRDLESWEK